MAETNRDDLSAAEIALGEELKVLGPLLERIDGEASIPDPAFMLALRAQLVGGPEFEPRRRFALSLGRRLAPTGRSVRRDRPWIVAAPAAALIAAGIVLVTLLAHSSQPQRAAVPVPSRADLTRTFPYLDLHPGGGGGGGFNPVASPFEQPAGVPYPAKLHLTAEALPTLSQRRRAFVLASHARGDQQIRTLASMLGIRHPQMVCMRSNGATTKRCHGRWRLVWDRALTIDYLAFSAHGELIYSDIPPHLGTSEQTPVSRRSAARSSRSFLERIGLRRSQFRLLRRGWGTLRGPADWVYVAFGWRGAPQTNIPAAQFWVGPLGAIVKAEIWPPLKRTVRVQLRSVTSAWSDVISGQAPLAVEGRVFRFPPGTGAARAVGLVDVLIEPPPGGLYLEPVYRFAGTAHLPAVGSRGWYSLVPAVLGDP